MNRWIALALVLSLVACGDDNTKDTPIDINAVDVDAGNNSNADGGNSANVDAGNVTTGPVCGNAVLEEGEACDGNRLDGATCETFGFAGGTLACAGNCQAVDTTGCEAAETCGNGVLDANETCDGDLLNNATCEALGRGPGTVRCAANCGSFDLSSCGPAPTCGNGAIDPTEVCDDALLGNATCESLGFGPGTLACGGNCEAYDTSACGAAPICGDDIINGLEECDGAALAGQTCVSRGFGAGTLACAGDCTFDTSACPPPPTCGDGTINGTETCDGAALGGQTCESRGFGPGTLACSADCMGFDASACSAPPRCGDGAINGMEVCDGALLAGQTCGSQGAGIGSLGCAADCLSFDTTQCCQPDCSSTSCGPDPVCGTSCGTCQQGENCDMGQCVCVPETCATLGVECGTIADGCGGTLDCGGCTGGLSCNQNSCSCPVVTSMSTYTIDVPTVDITFQVTLNGQPVTNANTNDSDEGIFYLVHAATGERMSLPETAAGTTANYPVTRRVIPGFYDIYYGNGGTQTNWPVNTNNLLIANADLTSSQTLNIDVPTVDITFEVTLGGQPVTSANTNDSDEGVFQLVDSRTGERMNLPETAAGTTPNYPTTRRVIPGNYDIYYANGGTQTNWPVNTNRRLYADVNLNTSQTFTIDVPVVDILFDVTLNGMAVTSANTNDSDEGIFQLVDPVTSERMSLPETAAGTTVNYPTTRRVIPGFYDIYYANGGTQTNWPVNTNFKLETGADFTSSGSYTINVPTVDITWAVTLNGQAVTSANTNDSDEGVFQLINVATGERSSLPETAAGTTPNYPVTRRIIPGNYHIHYANGGTQTNWPVNTDHRIVTNEAFTQSQNFTINVPTVDIVWDVTLNGVPVTAANTNDSDEGVFYLEQPVTGERMNLPETAAGTTPNYPVTRRVIPSNYDIYYGHAGYQQFWPANTRNLLYANVGLTTSQTFTINVPYVEFLLDVTLNGLAVTSANTNDSDEGVFYLETVGGERLSLPETAAGTTPNYPVSLRLIPDTYSYFYGNGGTQTNWPVNTNHLLGCFEVQ